jgi:hypothetical protein
VEAKSGKPAQQARQNQSLASQNFDNFNITPTPMESPGLNSMTQSLLDSMRETMWNQAQSRFPMYMPTAPPPPPGPPSQGIAIQTEDEVAVDQNYGGPQYWELQEEFQE